MFFHFIGKKSLELRSCLVNSVNKTIGFCKLKVVFPNQRKLNTLFQKRDAVNKEIRSFLVYRFMCSNCNVTFYRKITAIFLLKMWKIWVFIILLGNCKKMRKIQQFQIIYYAYLFKMYLHHWYWSFWYIGHWRQQI